MEPIQVPFEDKYLEVRLNEANEAVATIVLAHGAGAGMDHSFMQMFTDELILRRVNVVRFNFPYITEKKRFTGSPQRNIRAWSTVLSWAVSRYDPPIYVAGKSYGGRMVSHLAAEKENLKISGIIYVGFPLHAPGKPSTERAQHVAAIRYPQLFLQGTNDALADIRLIRKLMPTLPDAKLKEYEDADHSFKQKGKKHATVIQHLAEDVVTWLPVKLSIKP